MEVQILSKEFIKPSTSTPPSLQNYKISVIDEVAPTMNIPLIFYYPANEKCNISTSKKCQHLKSSLAKTLTKFYPLAGRYMRDNRSVDCSDQGGEFVEARVAISLDELLDQGRNLKVHFLNDFLPLPVGALDEITDPLLAVQVNVFDCGGMAIGLCVSHRVADMSTICTFLNSWSTTFDTMSPSFNLASSVFPAKGMPATPLGLTRTKEDIDVHKTVTKKFSFNKKAISSIRDQARLQDSRGRVPSRVQSVFGVITKALVDVGKVKHCDAKGFVVIQAMSIRERTVPPMPKNHFGNLTTLAISKSSTSPDECGLGFQGCVDMLSDSVKRAGERCGKMLLDDEDGEMELIKPLIELGKSLSDPEVFIAGMYSSWSRFSFYETDFGWGKPSWVSLANLPIKNYVVLIDDKDGDGIEAWVSLAEKDMPKFEMDSNINNFAA